MICAEKHDPVRNRTNDFLRQSSNLWDRRGLDSSLRVVFTEIANCAVSEKLWSFGEQSKEITGEDFSQMVCNIAKMSFK